jgi:hypothetical protein
MLAPRRLLTALLGVTATVALAATPAHAAGVDTWANWASAKQEAHIESLDFIGPQLFAGSEGDGIFTSGFAVGPWSQINGGLNPQEGDLNIHQVVASGGTLYAATTGGLFQGSSGGNWQPLAQGAGPRMLNEAVNTVYVNAPGDLVVGTASRGVFSSSDGGAHWDKATGVPDAESFFHIVSANGVLYGAASDGIFISLNAGRSWTLHSDGIPAQSVFRIGVGVGGGNELYASTSGGIYKSVNAGLTWNDASGITSVPGTFLPGGAKRGLFAGGALLGNRFVAGTQSGVWATIDGGDTWGQMSTDTTLPGQSMGAEIVNTVGVGFSPPALMAGTSARGVYSLALAPVTTGSAPTIAPATGVTVGEPLTASNGTWNGTFPLFFAYQWRRCDSGGNACSNIAGATGKSYTVVQADLNATIRVIVSAKNLLSPSAVPQTSTQTTVVTGAPANAPTPPAGFPKIGPIDVSYAWGKTFTIDPGSPWKVNGSPVTLDSTTYKWQRCDGGGANCVDIPGATGASYTSGKADIGKKLAGYVTATEAGSPTTSYAGQTLLIIEKKPVNTELPRTIGASYLGEALSSTAGAWDGNNLTYERQWLACEADGLGCTSIINDATGQSFVPTAQQLGKRLQVRVRAIADDGIQKRTTDAYSEPGPVVVTRPPAPVDPVVTPPGTTPGTTPPGTTPPTTTPFPLTSRTIIKLILPKRIKVGATLAAPKKIKGAKTVKYQWLRNGKKIRRATKRTYRVVRADRGKKLQLRLTFVTTKGKTLFLMTKSVKVPRR